MKKVAIYVFVIFLVTISYTLINQYVFGSKYVFAPPASFSGDSLYNPYQSINASHAKIANFHAHAKNGLLNGNGEPEDVLNQYKKIGVDIAGVSQYNKIEQSIAERGSSIPVYEHGINLGKTHQLVIGARQVVFKDYPFFQTIHNKQEILERISLDSQNVIALTHPDLSHGYSVDDIKYLHYYDLMEVLSPYANSIAYWDTALSAGKPIFAIGNDDVHDVFDHNELGRFVNIIFCDNTSDEQVVQALKKGQSAVLWLKQETDESLADKLAKISSAKNTFTSLTVDNDTINLKFVGTIQQLDIITDNGIRYASLSQDSLYKVIMKPEHSYLRFEASLTDGSKIIFNPVFRNNGSAVICRKNLALAHVARNPNDTFLGASFLFICIAFSQFFVKLNNRVRRRRGKDTVFNHLQQS